MCLEDNTYPEKVNYYTKLIEKTKSDDTFLKIVFFKIPMENITGMKPQSKLWKLIPQQAAGYYTLRFAGLFDLQISIHL
jgi:hypothetical protein